MSPARRRLCIERVRRQFAVSERRVCAALGQHRSTQRKTPRGRDDEARLTSDIVELARRYGRYGYRRITALLRAAGWLVNAKRVLMLGPVVLLMSLLAGCLRDEEDEAAPAVTAGDRPRRGRPALHELVPWFIVGFIAVALLRTFDLIPHATLHPIAVAATYMTIVSMAALGLGVDVRSVARAGLRVTAAVTLSLMVLGIISLALIYALHVA